MSGMTIVWFLGMAMGGAIALSGSCAIAQITPDGTLPNNSIVTPDGSTLNITGGTQAGGNLFHSFGEFSVRTGETAFFNNAVDIQNIISRVTGGSVSNIDGLIRANGTANLFLINPSGIIFGRNASLNIGGSFLGTTASSMRFRDGTEFSTTTPAPLLTISVPIGLGFTGVPGDIQMQSSFFSAGRTDNFRDFALVGGNVSLDNTILIAPGERVELGGLASSGIVELQVDGKNLSLSFPDNVTRASVFLTNISRIDVALAGGGSITVNARNLDIWGGSALIAGIGQGLGSVDSVAGDITLNATGEIRVVGSNVFNDVQRGAVGDGGDITINSGSLSLRDGARLSASTSGQGKAGNVTVRAIDAVSLADAAIFSTVEAGGFGKGGDVNINAATLSLIDGAQLLTATRSASATAPAGQGDAGNVNVNVSGALDIAGVKNDFVSGIGSFVDTGTVGNGGNIIINSGSFSLRDGAQLVASTLGQGKAGNVTVRATDAVSFAYAGILSTVEAGGVGKGGDIKINAATLSLIDGAQLATITRSASVTAPAGQGDAGNVNVNVSGALDIAGEKNGLISGIFSFVDTGTVGNGGNITINSGSLSLRDGAGLYASTFGQENAGTIKVNATAKVTISGRSSNFTSGLFVNSQSTTGIAGDIIVTAPQILLDNTTISAESASGNGGNINLQTDLLFLRRGAQISTSAGTAQRGGNGGNITITAPNGFIIAVPNENSDITANAFTGRGGRVDITARGIFGIQPRLRETRFSDITASSPFGISGDVNINTLDPDPSQGLVEPPTNLVDASQQIATACTSRGGQANSFTVTGRGGLPSNPSEPLRSRTVITPQWVSLSEETQSRGDGDFQPSRTAKPTATPAPIVEASGWVINDNGEVELVANAPNATPGGSWQTPINCSASKTPS